MTDPSEDERREREADTNHASGDASGEASNETSALPTLESAEHHEHEAPPIDIDDRDEAVSHADPPDVIELPDHPGEGGDDPDLVDRPLDHEFQPLPMEDEIETQPSSVDLADADAGDSAPEREPEADNLRWVPSGDPVPETAPDPTFERLANGTGESAGEEEETPGARFVHVDDNRESAEPSKASGLLAGLGAAARSARETVTGKGSSLAAGARSSDDSGGHGGERFLGMFKGNTTGDLLDPSLHAVTTLFHRLVLIGGAIAILFSLLSNNAGLALIIASAIVPVWIALTLNQQDLFEHESALLSTAVGTAGIVIGLIFSSLSSWLVDGNWFDNGVLNYGAAGFGGRFADLAGAPPLVVWFIGGLLLPLLAMGAIVAVPIAMRRWPQFRNEVMDGVILCGTSAAGFAIGSAIVFWAPMISDDGPETSVSDWTLTTLGMVLFRPIVITLAGAMLGAGVWKYMLTPAPGVVILPALGGIGGILLLTFGSLQLQPSGLWPELVWTLLIAIASFLIYRLVLNNAISSDRTVLGEDQGRVVCPSCHKITPAGAFCAHCGAVLEAAPAPAPAT